MRRSLILIDQFPIRFGSVFFEILPVGLLIYRFRL